MGRATKWLRGLFGIKSKEKYKTEYSVKPKEKIRWSSGPLVRKGSVMCHNPTTMIPPNITTAEAAWLRSFYSEPDSEQKQHARAVAAATAAAADAAMAAAQAAVTVARLTSLGCGKATFGGSREKWAAAKIQTAFRGYLARKALRALKGLVKIQALVRGFLVRKQAAAALHSMQALIRAQESVRALKTRRLINKDENFPPQFQAPKSLENFEEHPASSFEGAATNAFDENPKIVEVDKGCRPKSRSKRANIWISDSCDDLSTKAIPYTFPLRVPTPESKNLADREWGPTLDECHFSTPPKSVCTERYPNYMVNKQYSFKAKQRSQSAPKQRPESGPNRRLSLMESRNSLSGFRMPSSSSQAQEAINFKNAVIGKLGRSPNFVEERV